MKESPFLIATSIVIIFIIVKSIHSKFVIKEDLILKKIVRDSLFVYISVVIGIFIVDQVSGSVNSKATFAYTTNPDF